MFLPLVAMNVLENKEQRRGREEQSCANSGWAKPTARQEADKRQMAEDERQNADRLDERKTEPERHEFKNRNATAQNNGA